MPLVLPMGCLVVCAIMAIRSTNLLQASLWLILSSIFVSISLYTYGAITISMIELSIGAGLVAILLLFVISITGEETITRRSLLPRWFLALLGGAFLILLVRVPMPMAQEPENIIPFATVFWEQRSADILLQLALIFNGVLTISALLAGVRSAAPAANIIHMPQQQENEIVEEREAVL